MDNREARVIPLDEFRRRRQESRAQEIGSQSAATSIPSIVWVPIWMWVPVPVFRMV